VAVVEAGVVSGEPLAPLSEQEIEAAVTIAREQGAIGGSAHLAYVGRVEPDKEAVRHHAATPHLCDRRVRLWAVEGPEPDVTEVIVSLSSGAVVARHEHAEARPGLLMTESINSIEALRSDPRWQEAVRRRGIEDFDRVQIDPWPSGHYGLAHEEGRRICRCLSYFREHPEANGYARPLEGVVAFVDMGRAEVLEVIDTGVVPLPPENGSYFAEDMVAARPAPAPLTITQPEGPGFRLEGHRLEWQGWSMQLSMDDIEGLVLHCVGYHDGQRLRSILYRASVSEMVVPYGEPGELHGWKNAFDVGEWGLGRMADSLSMGCDCLGEIRYLDMVYCDETGQPRTRPQTVCVHEEDYGILWKHVDLFTGRSEVRRSRRLVVSSISTVGNYEYGFYWYFYLDGSIQFEVKLTGIMSTMAVPPGAEPRFANMVAPQLAAPYHQHLFNVRLDFEVDGPRNTVEEVDTVAVAPGRDNPMGNAFETVVTTLDREPEARRLIDPSRSRYWRVVNRGVRNRFGAPVAYKLVPGATPTLLADGTSSVARRAAFARANLWVTRFDPAERRAAGDYPNQHPGGDGVERWCRQDRPIVDEDIVVWYSFGVTHIPRPEDWPVMPVEYTGFHLLPVGFFEQNPALGVPPPSADCHAVQTPASSDGSR
jgi:primary-amine oxidase